MTTPVYPPAPTPADQPPLPPAFAAQPPPVVSAPLPQLADQQAAPVQVPEGGYAQRIVRIPLPAFRLPGLPEPWVELRNPGMMAPATLEEIGNGLTGVTVGPDGEPGEPDTKLILATLVRLLRGWCMWDATSEEDVPPLLPATVTVDLLQRVPVGVLKAIGAAFMELQNPQ